MTEIRCTLDYETRSAKDLETAGPIEYAKDPSTSIFCLGYKVNDGKVKLWVPEKEPMPADLWQAFRHGILVAHNAGFERAVTKYCLTRYSCLTAEQRDWLGRIPRSRWRCTAAKAAASSLPRKLEGAARVLRLPTQKDAAGHKLIKKYSRPRRPSKNDPSPWWHDPADLRRIYAYCKTDVQAEYELDEALPDLSEYEQKVWELDQKINDRGILIDIPTVEIILKMIHEEMGNVTRRTQKLSEGTVDKPTQTAKVRDWVNARGAEMENLRAETIEYKLLEPDLDPKIRQMLQYRQEGSKSSTAKYIAMIKAVGSDNRARELLLYHGTIPTARWAGRRVQPHNFPRPTIKDFNSDEAIALIKSGGLPAIRKKYGPRKVMNVLVSAIRGMIIASENSELFCADFAQVEARGAFWVADHKAGIQAFLDDEKLYEMMASETFDMDMEWLLTPQGKASLERFVGKESVLGCQYGMGWLKFRNQCWKKGMRSVTDKIAKKAVYTYRRVHYPIPELWRNLEEAAIKAIRDPGSRHRTNKVVFYVKGKFLNIKLPSGRRLRYFRPHLKQKQLASGRMVPEIRYWGMRKHQWTRCSIWGGIFCNHIVQGICRDLMVNGIFNIDEAGYRFLLSVHDEGLAEKRKGKGDVKEYAALMTRLPAWAKGFPIAAEAWCGPRYRK